MEELSVIQLAHAVYKQFYDLQTRVPQLHRKVLTQKAEAALLDFFKWTVQAKYATKPNKALLLLRAQADLELFRMQLRLMIELELANRTTLFQIQEKTLEMGRMLGSWLKSLHTLSFSAFPFHALP